MKIVKQNNREKSLLSLERVKKSHSKVKQVEHNSFQMQKYLKPNSTKITREEAQLIFSLRCRVTEAKVNLKGKCDNLECGACGLKEENQQHIVECKELNGNRIIEELNYNTLLIVTVTEKLKSAKKIKENYAKLENWKKVNA